jgi:outer membrane protein OmpA-like peptidoglycan-associated protein
MRPARLLPLLLLAACATARTPPQGAAAAAADGEVLREAELARIRCLLVAPLENGSDVPRAAGAATVALLSRLDGARAQAMPVEQLRALFADTPLELPEGISAATALELAELLGADAALYGAVEGRSRGGSSDLLVTLRLTMAGQRDLLFATTARVEPAPGEPVEAAVRRTVVDHARPMLERLGAPGRQACFPQERRDALRAAALALRAPGPAPASAPAPARAAPPPPAPAPPAGARPTLNTARQRDWARALLARGRVQLDEVTFTGRTDDLARDGGLADLAVVLQATPELTVRLEGFVDSSADAAGDQRLSAAMAQAAAARLRELGVEGGRVTTAGRGSESPILPNFTVRGRAANRRVEVVAPR